MFKKILLYGVSLGAIAALNLLAPAQRLSADDPKPVEVRIDLSFLDDKISDQASINRKAAVINGEYITYMDILKRIAIPLMQTKKEDPKNYKTKAKYLWQKELVTLARQMIITQAADKEGVTVLQEDVDSEYNMQVRQMGGWDQFVKILAQNAVTEVEFRKEIEDDLKRKRFVFIKMGMAPKDNTSSVLKVDVFVPPKEIKDFYDKNKAEFVVPKQVRFSSIVIKYENETEKITALEKGETISRQLDSGADFDTLAELYSDFKPKKDAEPEWVNLTTLSEQLQEVLDKMKPGEFSRLLPTRNSYRILRLDETKDAKQRTFDESTTDIKKIIELNKYNDALQDIIKQLEEMSVIWPDDLELGED